MDRPRRPARVSLIPAALLGVLLPACEPVEELVDPAEIEAQLRKDPSRPGKAAQLTGLVVTHHASHIARAFADAPDPDCTLAPADEARWTAELTLERRRSSALQSSWTETRTLDRTPDAASLEYSASFRTEVGGAGTQGAQWRVTSDGTYVGEPATDGMLWYRRTTEEEERERLEQHAWGMLQGLLDAAGGWEKTDAGWTASGEEPLRCSESGPVDPFVSRFAASAAIASGSLVRTSTGRQLDVTWRLADGSTLTATYVDRVGPLPAPVETPPADRVVTIRPDRSLARARALLGKMAESGLAEVASAPPPEPHAP